MRAPSRWPSDLGTRSRRSSNVTSGIWDRSARIAVRHGAGSRVRSSSGSRRAGRRAWVATSTCATPADTRGSPTTRAGTVTVRSVRAAPRWPGSKPARPTCCPCPTRTWFSRCRRYWRRLRSRTRKSSTISCSAARPRRFRRSPVTRSISVPGSGSLPSYIPGARRSSTIPHVHCVVPAGGLSEDGRTWRACRPGFFLPVRVLSRLFRGKFVAGLHEAFREGRLELHGRLACYRSSSAFGRYLHEASRTEWVVYAKPPFDAPERVLEYLARYTHRIAISNHRLLHVDDEAVTLRYKDYRGSAISVPHAPARRVLSPLPAPRPPQGLRPYPPLWVPRQRLPRATALVLPWRARSARGRAGRPPLRAKRGQRTLPRASAPEPTPLSPLWTRSDAVHRSARTTTSQPSPISSCRSLRDGLARARPLYPSVPASISATRYPSRSARHTLCLRFAALGPCNLPCPFPPLQPPGSSIPIAPPTA